MLMQTRRLVLLLGYESAQIHELQQDWEAGFAGRFTVTPGAIASGYFLRLATTRSRMSGVNMSSMASPIFPPGTTMVFGRDMNEL